MNRTVQTGLIAVLLISGALFCGKGIWIQVKGQLAQLLLKHSWQQTLVRQQPVKPWPWADTWPVARLRAPRYKQDMIVLAGQQGATLAFGPGMLEAGSRPGQPGTCILAGHRDTNFRFLQRVQPGDVFLLEDTDGTTWKYKVNSTAVREARDLYIRQMPLAMLVLITCYPFNAVLPGTPLRYVVLAEKV